MVVRSPAWEHAKEIAEEYGTLGVTERTLAREYDCSRKTVSRILRAMDISPKPSGSAPLESRLHIPDSDGVIGYVAGIIDADGTISLDRGTTHWNVRVGNNSQELIHFLAEQIGGAEYGPYKTTNGNNPHYFWTVNALKEAKALLDAVLPYLIVKRDKALEALSFIERRLEIAVG